MNAGWILAGALLAVGADTGEGPRKEPEVNRTTPSPDFFEHCAFVSVDFQQGDKTHVTDISAQWKEMGYTVEDCNAAIDFAHDVALPNAVKAAEACRALKMPMVFIHWDLRFDDGMDLEPRIRRALMGEKGGPAPDFAAMRSRPADAFRIRKGEYVIPKSGQDAFPSSCIEFVLRNLEIEHIVFVGGHTNPGGCLHQTARSAQRLGFRTLCIEDATFDAGESTRLRGVAQTEFDHVISTDAFLAAAESVRVQRSGDEAPSPAPGGARQE